MPPPSSTILMVMSSFPRATIICRPTRDQTPRAIKKRPPEGNFVTCHDRDGKWVIVVHDRYTQKTTDSVTCTTYSRNNPLSRFSIDVGVGREDKIALHKRQHIAK